MSTVPTATKSLGLAACTAIVLGNMVGSGFYLAPAALAPYGQLAILAWIVMGAGAICLGLSFARLAGLSPATGGPYAYTRIGFGDFMGFLIAWGYWISIWTSLPVVALAFAGAMMNMIPAWHGRTMALTLTLGSMWLMVGVNLCGVRMAGLFAQFTTVTKMVPFIAIAILGLFYIEPANLAEFNPSGQPVFTAIAALAPLTMFAYFGLESATVPAGDVQDAGRTIPRATILGISIAAVLNGWTLLMGQVPMAAAQDGLFPAAFGRVSARGVPAIGVVISALLATALVVVQAAGSPGVQKIYNLIVNLSTMTAAIAYAFCVAAVGLLAAKVRGGPVRRITMVDLVAFLFALFTVYGCGPEPVLYGLMLLLMGIPVYVWQRRQRSHDPAAADATR